MWLTNSCIVFLAAIYNQSSAFPQSWPAKQPSSGSQERSLELKSKSRHDREDAWGGDEMAVMILSEILEHGEMFQGEILEQNMVRYLF